MSFEEEKIQVQRRMKKLVVPCDRLSNHMFNYSVKEYADIINFHDECGCREQIKKIEEVVTPYWLELVEGYVDLLPPNAFHRELLFHAMSAFEQGFRILTISITLDGLTGEQKFRVYKEQYEAIKAAFDKLGFTRIKINLAPLFKACPNYKKNYTGKAELVGTLLPMSYFETEINGQKTLAIKLLDESPLMTVAKIKKQLLTYDATPLAISGQKNTPQVITVKNWLLRRIELMKQRDLSTTILIKNALTDCGLADANRWQRQDFRKILDKTLSSFKADGVIQNFEFERQDGTFRAIKISLFPRADSAEKSIAQRKSITKNHKG